MAQESSTLEEMKNIMTETNRILRVAFADQLKAAIQRAANKAMAGEEDQITNHILNCLLLQPQTAEELTSKVGTQQGISRRTIQRRLEKLAEANIIAMQRRGNVVQYVLQMEALV